MHIHIYIYIYTYTQLPQIDNVTSIYTHINTYTHIPHTYTPHISECININIQRTYTCTNTHRDQRYWISL